ncbi:MAG: DUF5615 family PIN-like protein [Dehalococcoidia bacterium]
MPRASDSEVLARARVEERVIVSADTDFAMLLALRDDVLPSLILFRHPLGTPRSQADRVIAALPDIEESLNGGCIVAVEETRMRIRRLPISEYRDT